MSIYGFTTWGQPITLGPYAETVTIWKYYRPIAGGPLMVATDNTDILLGLAVALGDEEMPQLLDES